MKYSLVRSACSLDPKEIISKPVRAIDRMKELLSILHGRGKISTSNVRTTLDEFSEFCSEVKVSHADEFKKFSHTNGMVID